MRCIAADAPNMPNRQPTAATVPSTGASAPLHCLVLGAKRAAVFATFNAIIACLLRSAAVSTRATRDGFAGVPSIIVTIGSASDVTGAPPISTVPATPR